MARIVLATGVYPPDIGGPSTYVKKLAVLLKEAGHAVTIVHFAATTREYDDAGIRVYAVGRDQNVAGRYFGFFKRLWTLSGEIDLLYAFDIVSVGIPAALVRFFKPRLTLVARLGGDFLWEKAFNNGWTTAALSTYFSESKNGYERLMMFLNRTILRQADGLIFSTAWQKELYEKTFGAVPGVSTVIENAVPRSTAAMADSAPKEYLDVVFAGRFIKLKNLSLLIAAVAEVPGARLTLIGTGPDEERLKNEVRTRGLENRVTWVATLPHDELQERVRAAGVVVVPSISEISPNVVFEAISQGVPVLVTRETGINEELKKVLMTFDPFNKEELRAALMRLTDPEAYRQYRDAVRGITQSRGWVDVARDHETYFSALLAKTATQTSRFLFIGNDKNALYEGSAVGKRMQAYFPDQLVDSLVLAEARTAPFERPDGTVRVIYRGGVTKLVNFLRSLWWVAVSSRKNTYTLVCTQDVLFSGLLGAFAARLRRLPLIVQVHGDYVDNPLWIKQRKLNRLLNRTAKWVIRQATAVRVVSERLRQSYIRDFGIAPERVVSIPIGVDLSTFLAAPEPAQREPIIVFIGRLIEEKSPLLFARAAGSVLKKYGTVRAVVIGEGHLKAEMQRYFTELGVAERVAFTGFIPAAEIAGWCVRSRVLVHTAAWEGWGMPMIEAMAAGCPVVTTDSGCAGEAVRNGDNGVVVPVDDEAGLILGIEKLLNDDVTWKTYSERSRIEAKKWSFDELKKQFATLCSRYAKTT